ncbi:MAG: nucleotide pyrophosphohydrolase [Elusimicrobiales bacterium]|nr:nucleotide pyrophosphohydrolase [Elusimicrobiales bacterium]
MKISFKKSQKYFTQLLNIMHKLCSSKGCPWDRIQTHNTLLKYLDEEVKEFKIAVKKNDYNNMKEEIGDILLQVVFHCEIAARNGRFDIADVIKNLNNKLIRRHPHVFKGDKCYTAKDVIKLWKKIKKEEVR